MNRTILRYPGGKFRARKAIADLLGGCETIASPFFGGGSVELELADRGCKITASELFKPVACLWIEVKKDPERVTEAVQKLLGADRSQFSQLQKEVREGGLDPFELAWRTFVINRTSFSGATLSGGIGSGQRFTQGSIDRIVGVCLDNVVIHHGDYWEKLFQSGETYDGVYADPPYALVNSKLYGDGGDTHSQFDHHLFAERMKKLSKGSRIVISYNDCPLVRSLYSDWDITPISWAYGMNKSKKSNEVLIVNF